MISLTSTLLTTITVLVLTHAANASVRLYECTYNIHAVDVSQNRSDHYFQNDLEMLRVNANLYRGSVPLVNGYRLGIEASIKGPSIQIKSLIHAGREMAVQLSGTGHLPADGKSKSYLLLATRFQATNDLKPSLKTVFDRAEVRCLVGPVGRGGATSQLD